MDMNRKYLSYIFLAVVILLAGYLVYNRFESKDLPHEFLETASSTATSTPAESIVESLSTTTKYYDLSYDVPKDNKIVAQSIKSRADKWLQETNITKITDDAQAEREFGIFEGLRYSYDSKYKTVDSGLYTSYVETVYEFTGGAHGSTNTVVYVFSKKDGKQINSITDIYNDNILSVLSSYTRRELPAQLSEKTIVVSDFQDMFDDGTEVRQENWQTFYFKDSSLVVVFGQYQIGPYVIGIHELEVPLAVLEKYKK